MKKQIGQLLKPLLVEWGVGEVAPVVEFGASLNHGDYTTNVAMVLAKRLKRSPLDISKEIKNKLEKAISSNRHDELVHFTNQSGQNASNLSLKSNLLQDIDRIEIVPPGFINFYLSASSLSNTVSQVLTKVDGFGTTKSDNPKRIMVEFAHPNTHKAFHIGHLRNITTGETVVRLLESQGHEIIRVNYQGDVGMHIAKCLYGIFQISNENPEEFVRENHSKSPQERAEILGKVYAVGSSAFEESDETKEKVKEINQKIYDKSDPNINKLYQETRQWSLDYFQTIYDRVGTTFKRLYFESEFAESGTKLARDAVKKGILSESDGAIIFNGKPYGLDTRVFINSLGLPTYEGKELGLAKVEFTEFGELDQIIHVVGPEQASFFKVTFKVQELIGIHKNQQRHLVYGWVKLKHGKMSSRTGNVVLGEWLIDETKKTITTILEKSASKYTKEEQEKISEKAAIAAVKYSFLKVGTQQEIAFDIEESVNFEGDSGPYLLYTYARAKSVLRKSGKVAVLSEDFKGNNDEENNILRWLSRYREIVTRAAEGLSANTLSEYLYDLARLYNTFYNKHSILASENDKKVKDFRLQLTAATAQVLKNGLCLLGIETLEQM